MSAPVKPRKKAAPKGSPKAAAVEPDAGESSELTDEELTALATEPVENADGKGPVVIGKRGRRGEDPPELTPIFAIDGQVYSIPKEPSAALVLRYLIDIREHGRPAAVESMCLFLLGKENLDALAACPDVEKDDVVDILSKVGLVFFGSETYNEIIDSAGN